MTPIYKKHMVQRVQEMLDKYLAEGRLPTTIYVPRSGFSGIASHFRVALPPVRRRLDASFMTHEVRIAPHPGDTLEATLMPKVSDQIAQLRMDAIFANRELEAIELSDYEAAVLLVEQEKRVSFYNAMCNPEETEWSGTFMGIPLRLGKSLENNDF